MAHGRMKEKEARAKFRQVGVTPPGPTLAFWGLAYREGLSVSGLCRVPQAFLCVWQLRMRSQGHSCASSCGLPQAALGLPFFLPFR